MGDLEAIKKHLEGGADVNGANKGGYTALHMAVRRGQKEAVALLLEKGANVNAERKGKTPLEFAGKNEEIAALLREKGGKTGKENQGRRFDFLCGTKRLSRCGENASGRRVSM